MKAKAIVFEDVGRVGIQEIEIPAPGPGEILCETLFTAVSPGTELRCLSGKQEGTGFPFIPGYANVGRVIAAGPGAGVAEGTPIMAGGTQKASVGLKWGAHCSHVVRAASDFAEVPEGVEPGEASMARLAAISYHGMRMSNPRPDEDVVVIGLGVIGLLSAWFHHVSGARVVAFDLSGARVERARKLGLEACRPEGDMDAAVRRYFPEGADVVVDSTGSAGVLRGAARLARVPAWGVVLRDRPRLLIQGSYPGDFALDYHEAFFREMSILLPRDQTLFDLKASLELIRRGKLPVRAMIGEPFRVEEAPEVYRRLREEPDAMLTAVFRWK